jgi:hypothetical protein
MRVIVLPVVTCGYDLRHIEAWAAIAQPSRSTVGSGAGDRSGIDDLHAMLVQYGDSIALGSADEQKPAKDGTVEAWARSQKKCNNRMRAV